VSSKKFGDAILHHSQEQQGYLQLAQLRLRKSTESRFAWKK
jgi:hypothetical protein